MSDETRRIPFIEQAKAQAQVLVPLLKAFEAEVGAEKARAIARRALGDWTRESYRRIREGAQGNPVDLMAAGIPAFAEGALEYEVVAHTPERLDFDVTRCRYAEFYQALGEPELGFLFLCELDVAMAEGFGDDLAFTRTQTIMQGADRCDFRYRRRS